MNHCAKLLSSALVSGLLALPSFSAMSADVAYVTNQKDGVNVINLSSMATEKIIDMNGDGPRGLAITPDGKFLLTANQKTGDVAVIDTDTLKVVRRIPVGKNPEFMRILPDGSMAFVTYEPSSSGKPPGKDDDESGPELPGHVAVIDLHKWAVVESIVGAPETEGIEFAPDGKNVAITNEGNDTITVYNFVDHKLTKTVDLHPYGLRPRGIKLSPDGKHYVVTLESSANFLVLDTDFKVIKSVPTGKGPYGVAFDKSGSRILIAAAISKHLQVFDARTYKHIADVPVGKRCWHFSFTPDESKILAVCGRSDEVDVIDAASYKVDKKLTDFNIPCGIVTYPKSYGSLDAPAK